MFTTSIFDRITELEIVCPACKGDLVAGQNELHCPACSRGFPIIAGIPDLRLFADPYISIEADREKGEHLASREKDFDFAGLVNYYYSITPAVPSQHARQYIRGLLSAPSRAETALSAWEARAEGKLSELRLLELGCGTAPLLVVAASRYANVIGIDIAFRWLVIARKRIAETGFDIPLLCACAEHLPFRSNIFDRVVSESVIEQVKDQVQTLWEAKRVLKNDGHFFFSTPNRFSLGPDPQAGMWAGGYLPRSWVDSYMKRQGAVPPRRNLLSLGSLRRLIEQAGLSQPQIFLPQIPRQQRLQFGKMMQTLIASYNAATRLPGLKQVLLRIGPLLQGVTRPVS